MQDQYSVPGKKGLVVLNVWWWSCDEYSIFCGKDLLLYLILCLLVRIDEKKKKKENSSPFNARPPPKQACHIMSGISQTGLPQVQPLACISPRYGMHGRSLPLSHDGGEHVWESRCVPQTYKITVSFHLDHEVIMKHKESGQRNSLFFCCRDWNMSVHTWPYLRCSSPH